MISDRRDKLMKRYGANAEKVAYGRAIAQAKKQLEKPEEEIKYFQGEGGTDRLRNIQDFYNRALADKLEVSPHLIKPAEFDYQSMTGKIHKVGDPYPDIIDKYKHPRELWNSNILKIPTGTKAGAGNSIALTFKYAMPNSQEHIDYKNSTGREPETLQGLIPAGYNKDGEPLVSGKIIDRRNNIIKIEKL